MTPRDVFDEVGAVASTVQFTSLSVSQFAKSAVNFAGPPISGGKLEVTSSTDESESTS
jgi:hypothetical protein